MRMIKIVPFSSATHTNNLPIETGYSEWNSTTAYTNNQKVYYNCKLWSATGNISAGTVPSFESNNPWNFDNLCNKGGMFDLSPSTSSTSSSTTTSMTASISSMETANTVALMGLEGEKFRLKVKDGLDVTYDSGYIDIFESRGIDTFYKYYFNPNQRKKDFIIDNIPPITGQVAELEIVPHSGGAKLGVMLFGFLYELGNSQWGSGFGARSSVDFTDIDLNNVRYVDLKPTGSRKFIESTIEIKNYETQKITRLLDENVGKINAFFIQDRPDTITLGLFRDYKAGIPYPEIDILNLYIEGAL